MIGSPQLTLCISIVSRALILARRKLFLEQDKSTYAILAATLKTTFVAVSLQKRRKNCECCPVSSVTLDFHVTEIVMNSCSQMSEL